MGELRVRNELDFLKKISRLLPHIKPVSEYKNSTENIDCYCTIHNVYWTTKPFLLYNNYGCPQCSLEHMSRTKTKTTEQFKIEVKEVAPQIDILSEYVNQSTKINCYCNKHNYFWSTTPYYLLQTKECPMEKGCKKHSSIIIKGINDVGTTNPEVIKYFKHPEEANEFSCGSSHRIVCVCPYCGAEKQMRIGTLVSSGFYCDYCGDSISYPNKFGRSFVRQLPVQDLKFEYSPKWADRKRYDIYFKFNNLEYIIEMDGEQHYRNDTLYSNGNKNDKIKEQLAKEHNINLIRIDCSKSNKEYISNNIKNSILSNMFDLSIVDWKKCDILASNSTLGSICDYYNNIDKNINKISQHFNLGINTIRAYLVKGVKLNICDYNYKPIKHNREVDIYDINNNFIVHCKNIKQCVDYVNKYYGININVHGVRNCCNGATKSHKKFVFQYND